jgi:hypothetical protein
VLNRTVVPIALTNRYGPIQDESQGANVRWRCSLAHLVSSLRNHSSKVDQTEQGKQVHKVMDDEHLFLLSLLEEAEVQLKKRYGGGLRLERTTLLWAVQWSNPYQVELIITLGQALELPAPALPAPSGRRRRLFRALPWRAVLTRCC